MDQHDNNLHREIYRELYDATVVYFTIIGAAELWIRLATPANPDMGKHIRAGLAQEVENGSKQI